MNVVPAVWVGLFRWLRCKDSDEASGTFLVRFSGIDAEQPVDEGRLGSAAHGLDPQLELALPEHPHHLEPLDRRVGCLHRLEAERRLDQALQLCRGHPPVGC